MKTCSTCNKPKPLSEFCKHKKSKDGLNQICRSCARENSRKWSEANKEYRIAYAKKYRKKNRKKCSLATRNWYYKNHERLLLYAINTRLKKNYGITLDEKIALREAQNNKCAICSTEFNLISDCKIDHDHKTGKIRELLCNSCNSMLGHVKEDIRVLTNAIAYINKHSIVSIEEAKT